MAIREVGGGKDYSNISTAVGAASAGDTILIYSGTYTDNAVGLYVNDITFQCATGSEGDFEVVLLSGSDPATKYLIQSYGVRTTYNNLTFTGYRYVPSLRSGGSSARIRMSGCLAYHVGNTTNTTIQLGGNSGTWTGSMENCKVFNMQAYAVGCHQDYVEINNCLIVNDVVPGPNHNQGCLFDGSGKSNTTASFCTFVGKNQGTLVKAAKIVNCIVSGSQGATMKGESGWTGCDGIESDDSDYNVVTVDQIPFKNSSGAAIHMTSSGDHEYTLVAPYFTNPGTLGSSNYLSDNYTLVQTKDVAGATPTSYFTMENGSGTTLSDVSSAGNGRNGTLVNSPTWDSSNKKVGSYSLEFDAGTDEHVTLHDVPQDIRSSDFSIAFWVKTAYSDRSNTAIALGINGTPANANATKFNLFASNSGKWNVGSSGSGGFLSTAPAHRTLFIDNKWHHFCFTFNNTTKLLRVYMDGEEDGANFLRVGHNHDGDPCCSLDSVTGKMYLGKGYSGGASPAWQDDFGGNIDELSIWDKILEPEHIKDLYAAGLDNESKNSGFSAAAYTNPAIGAGVGFTGSFGAVTTDLSGATRPQDGTIDIGAYEFIPSVATWSEYTGQPELKWGTDLSLNNPFKNLSSNYKYKYSTPNRQAPFSFVGVTKIRGSQTPYKTEK